MRSQRKENLPENPQLTGWSYQHGMLTLSYTRFSSIHRLVLQPESLAQYLKELGAIEGYCTCSETGKLEVLYQTFIVCGWDENGQPDLMPSYAGEPLRKWVSRELDWNTAQALCVLHETLEDARLLKTGINEIIKSLNLGDQP